MSRELLAGSVLNEISGSIERWPGWQVLVWNPNQVTMAQLVTGQAPVPPVDLSPYVESIHYTENIGFENSNNPKVTSADIKFRRNPITGQNIRRGLIEDGVLVRILQGDQRVRKEDWIVVFTGTFRGSPGDDPGTKSTLTENYEATAYGREERYLNLFVTTDSFPGPVDLGVILRAIAMGTNGVAGLPSGTVFPTAFTVNALFYRTDLQSSYQNTGTFTIPVWTLVSSPSVSAGMGLTQDEVLIGALGYLSQHVSNQIVEDNCLDALWQLLFPVGKKPKFDSLGRLTAVDIDIDKPAVKCFSAGDFTIESIQRQPNDVDVNNQVVLQGLDFNLTGAIQATQLLTTIDAVTGFFDNEYRREIYFSADHTQAAQNTYVSATKNIWFSDPSWSQADEFHGILDIDTHYLLAARATIFGLYLATELSIAAIDYTLQSDTSSGLVGAVVTTLFSEVAETLATIRLAMKIASQVALAGLLWSMNYIGRGTYEIWGQPYVFAYQQLVSQCELFGLAPEDVRTLTMRNDFLDTMDILDARAKQLLRREMVKNQVYQIVMTDDYLIEVDDVIATSTGERFYVNTVDKTLQFGQKASVTLTCWKVFDPTTAAIVNAMSPDQENVAENPT